MTFPKSTTKWKQVCYIGNSMTAGSFNYFIDVAKNAGITHIIIHFIVCDLNNTKLTFNGTVNAWENYTTTERQSLINKMNSYGIVFMASFGGVSSFLNSFVQIFNSSKYKNSETLANDLIEWMIINKIYGIDINIDKLINTFKDDLNTETQRDNIINYLGSLSQKIKMKGQQLGFYIHISHAVLPDYFNGPTGTYEVNSKWKNIYNDIEKIYGNYIDFYNVKYYNLNIYTSYNNMFINDDRTGGAGNNAAILQLIDANQYNSKFFPIPEFKIVTGKPSQPIPDGNPYGPPKFVELINSNSRDTTTFAYFIRQNNQAYSNTKLQKWFTSGGIMIWEYKNFDNGELDTTNEYNKKIIDLFTSFK